jgi:multidrug resistance efflux pump
MDTVLSLELPRLRRDLRVSQQETTGEPAFVLKDPLTGRFFRFREAELFITQQLDGGTPFEVIGRKVEERFGQPISTDSLKLFVDRLQRLGLLESATAVGQQSRAEPGRIRGDVFYLRFKAFDPDRFLNWLSPYVRFCFTPAFLFCSAVLILFTIGLTVVNWDEITRDLSRLYRVETLILVWFTIFIVTTLHEFAHGLTCKRFGGEVHELGFMLLFFQPAFYCNVSDAWLFPEKAKRLWVSFAGAYFEVFLWALATVAWRVTNPETWVSSVALVVMGTSAIRSLFNLNPLIKLDGYYLLSDALEVPNLRARAFGYLKAMIKRMWGAPLPDTVSDAPRRERRIFLAYSLLAGVYSVWLLGTIALWVGGWLVQRYQGVGFLLFAGLLLAVFRRPLRKVLPNPPAWLTFANLKTTFKKRPVKGFLLAAGILAILILGRLELTISGEFTVLPIQNADVRAEVEGIIEEIYVSEGDLVRKGDLVARLSDRTFQAELRKTEAEIEEKKANLRMLKLGPRSEEIALARQALGTAKTRHEQARKRFKEADRFRAERLARAEASLSKAQERLKYAQMRLDQYKMLLSPGFISRKEYEDVEEQGAIREKELEEARITVNMVLADDLGEFRKEQAVTEKELAEVEGKLRLLLAGSRLEEIEATEAEIARLEAQRRYLEDQLGLMRVVSPHAGVITTPHMKQKLGQKVEKGDLIAEVHELSTVRAEIAILEQEVGDLQVGQAVVVKARSYPEISFIGTVAAIAPAAAKPEEGRAGKVVRVTTEIDNASLLLKSQMTGTAKIYCGERRIADLMTRRLARFFRVEFWSWW